MTTYSSFPGFVEFIAPPGGSIVAGNFFGEIPWLNLKLELVFVFGSLSRPPEVSSSLFPWRHFTGLVCLWLQASLSDQISLGNLSVGDVVTLWYFDGIRTLAPRISVVFDGFHATAIDDHAFWRYDPIEGELRLDVLKLLEYGIDNGWLVMLLEHPVFTSKIQSLELLSIDCKEYSLILIFHLCKFTRLSLFIKPLVGYSVRLLLSAVEKFNQEGYPHSFQDVLCVDFVSMRNIPRNPHLVASVNQLLIWYVIFLPRMKKETSFFSSWLIYIDSYASSRYITSQGEFCSTFRLEALRLMLLWPSLVYLDEQQIVKEFPVYLKLLQSQEGAAICVSKELFSVTNTWSHLEFMHNSNGNGNFGSDGQHLILVVKFFYTDKEEIVSFQIAVTSWSITSQSCSHSLNHEDSSGFVGQLLVLICDQAFHLIFLHSHSCAFLLSQRWWLANKKLIVGDCHVLLLQGQSRELYFLGLKIVAHSGGLHTIQCFFFGSLTRPPESQGDFSFMPLKFTWMLLSLEDCRGYEAVKFFKSKMDFHLEGEY